MELPNARPTILMVHGSWHPPEFYKTQLDLIETHDFPTACPRQPSVGALPPIGLMEDAQAIQHQLKELIEVEGKDVIVVGHSYGGVVTSQAVDPTFGKKARTEQGKPGGVIHLLFVTAWIVPLGESLGSMLGSPLQLPPFIPTKENGMCMMLDPETRFYNDLSPAEQKKWASQLVECPAVAQLTAITQAAYLHYPSTYLFCDNDQGIPLFLQEQMVADAEAVSGRAFRHEHCSAGHSPFLSQPDTILKVIEKIAAEFQ
ncbi:alpha beta-hydrolase [Thozetella sp. PMI_491]|nr:alpha beta-hydrolase [Thozetella sp. PMI_491]